MKAIVNTKLILDDGIIWDGAITFDNGVITALGKKEAVDISSCDEVHDAGGLYTAPGLVDLHNHGCTECDFATDPMRAAEFFLLHGVTTVLPTFYHTLSMDDMIKGAERIRRAQGKGAGKTMLGLYMEGPFMRFSGGFKNQIKWGGGAILREDYEPLIDAFGDMVRVWAIDPDRENIEEFMQYVNEKTPNAIFAHGHSKSTFEAISRLKHYGVKLRTHIFCAGSAKSRCQILYGAGGDHFCLYDPDMYAEMICDETGIHLDPGFIRMTIRNKGVERVCLISDHTTVEEMGYKNNEEEGIWYGPDLNYDDRGWLAGSLMTLDDGVRNVMTHSGYGLCHAIRMASLNPATAIGVDREIGSLAVGKRANLIMIDDMVHVKKVFLEGELSVNEGKLLI